MEHCSKCNCKLKPELKTRHHILPVTFYKGKGKLANMCQKCHREIEKIYLKAEGGVRGKRIKLTEFEYCTLYYQFIWGEDYDFIEGEEDDQ